MPENVDDLRSASAINVGVAMTSAEEWRVICMRPAPDQQVVMGWLHAETGCVFVGVVHFAAELRSADGSQDADDMLALENSVEAEGLRLWEEQAEAESQCSAVDTASRRRSWQ